MNATNFNRGFALIEAVILILALGVFGVMYMSMTGQVWRSVVGVKDIENGLLYGQECMEHILSTRRNPSYGFATIAIASPSTICNGLPALSGYARTVNITDGAAEAACPAGSSCKKINVIVTAGATNVFDQVLLLVN